MKKEKWGWKLEVKDYDPNQPRAPAGSATGGQWTSGGGLSGATLDPSGSDFNVSSGGVASGSAVVEFEGDGEPSRGDVEGYLKKRMIEGDEAFGIAGAVVSSMDDIEGFKFTAFETGPGYVVAEFEFDLGEEALEAWESGDIDVLTGGELGFNPFTQEFEL